MVILLSRRCVTLFNGRSFIEQLFFSIVTVYPKLSTTAGQITFNRRTLNYYGEPALAGITLTVIASFLAMTTASEPATAGS